MADDAKLSDFDLDEDLFGFEARLQEVQGFADDEEDLEAIFAAFQEEEDALATALEAGALDEGELELPVDADCFVIEASDVAQPGEAIPDSELKSTLLTAPRGPARPSHGDAGTSRATSSIASGSSRTLARGGFAVLAAMTALNSLVALVTLRNAATMRDSVIDAQAQMTRTAEEIRSESMEQARGLIAARTPVATPDVESHPAFERAQGELERGEYAEARQRLYALLAIVDRLEESQRRPVEARALFLLARASHLEGLERMEVGG